LCGKSKLIHPQLSHYANWAIPLQKQCSSSLCCSWLGRRHLWCIDSSVATRPEVGNNASLLLTSYPWLVVGIAKLLHESFLFSFFLS
jgi:hypothetical protein